MKIGIPPRDAWKVYPNIGLKGLAWLSCRTAIPRNVAVTYFACYIKSYVYPAGTKNLGAYPNPWAIVYKIDFWENI